VDGVEIVVYFYDDRDPLRLEHFDDLIPLPVQWPLEDHHVCGDWLVEPDDPIPEHGRLHERPVGGLRLE
jgi:hypothetical protein